MLQLPQLARDEARMTTISYVCEFYRIEAEERRASGDRSLGHRERERGKRRENKGEGGGSACWW